MALSPKRKREKQPEVKAKQFRSAVLNLKAPKMGRLVYREGGKCCATDLLPLDPEHETYYYSKYCFGKKDENGRLYTLIGNKWKYGGPFRTCYFDAEYNCREIDYILEPDEK